VAVGGFSSAESTFSGADCVLDGRGNRRNGSNGDGGRGGGGGGGGRGGRMHERLTLSCISKMTPRRPTMSPGDLDIQHL